MEEKKKLPGDFNQRKGGHDIKKDVLEPPSANRHKKKTTTGGRKEGNCVFRRRKKNHNFADEKAKGTRNTLSDRRETPGEREKKETASPKEGTSGLCVERKKTREACIGSKGDIVVERACSALKGSRPSGKKGGALSVFTTRKERRCTEGTPVEKERPRRRRWKNFYGGRGRAWMD